MRVLRTLKAPPGADAAASDPSSPVDALPMVLLFVPGSVVFVMVPAVPALAGAFVGNVSCLLSVLFAPGAGLPAAGEAVWDGIGDTEGVGLASM